jgi:alpha-L-fucosidase
MRFADQYQVEDTRRAEREAAPEALRRFREAGYGLSVHWGLYSLSVSGSEWIYYTDRIPFDVYRQRLERFNPARFNADEWADLMVEAGQKFLVITTKHHDGFCLWDTALTDFNITHTPFGRDVLAELAPALHARGLGLHFYYSLVDWTHPAYRHDWAAYVAYYQGQLRELCARYGEVGGFIFAPRGAWDLAGTYDLIHTLQPQAVIANNAHVLPLKGEYFQVWELDLPGENKIGFNTTEVGDKPTASWWNLNSGWSYQPWQHKVRSADETLRLFRTVRDHQAVFILNVGPRPFGDLHPEEQHVLRAVGQAMREGIR